MARLVTFQTVPVLPWYHLWGMPCNSKRAGRRSGYQRRRPVPLGGCADAMESSTSIPFRKSPYLIRTLWMAPLTLMSTMSPSL